MIDKDKLNECGFTIIELVVVLTIITILVAIAVPAFSHFSKKYRADGAVFEIVAAFEKGKMLAIKLNEDINFSVDIDGDGIKDSGYCLYLDINNDNKVQNSEVINRIKFERVEFDFDKTTVDGASKPIVFYDDGFVKAGSVVINLSEDQQKKVSISILGKVGVQLKND